MHYTQIKSGLFPKFRLDVDYVYRINLYDVILPRGFTWDGATLGSFVFWRKSIHTSEHTLFHDYAYKNLGQVTDKLYLPRSVVDKIFFAGIKKDINPQQWRLAIARIGVKIGGAVLWNLRKIRG